ncbi:MAG: UDP-glucose 4-epimerase GalE [Sulfitobacter sp.]
MGQKILLTGGAGFIGSHTYVALVAAGYEVTLLDNFANAQRDVPDRLALITNRPTNLIECDVRVAGDVMAVMADQKFDAVVHFAAGKSISDGEADPIGYHQTNCTGLINVVAAMRATGCNAMVFSSSAAVYGNTDQIPIREDTALAPENTYAWTKQFGEEFLTRVSGSHPEFKTGILRYFNPVGAHASGLIGEDPSLPPSNLVPVIARVAKGQMEKLKVFGGDYPTADGTGIRDFIHISDLAQGHVLSLNVLLGQGQGQGQSHLVNLGTGTGYSVLEVLKTYSEVCGIDLPYEIVARRPGDAALSYAGTDRAFEILGFKARHDLRSMCESNWAFACRE